MDLENKSSRRWSPVAVSPLDAKKMEKDKQFEIQRLKEHRKTVLGNLTKQINIISPLLADFESEKQVPTEVK